MQEKELRFDRKKHLLYSKTVKSVIQKHLAAHYPPQQAQQYWEDTQRAYVDMLDLIPYLGGKKNGQAGSVYDCAALFAYYQAVPDKPDLAEFGQMNDELFLPTLQRGSFADLNKPVFMGAARFIWTTLSKRSASHRQDWPGNYIMEMRDCPEGAKYVFLRCPIAELAKKLGYTHLMPAMCNPDYPMLKCLKGGLIRSTTCANGDYCDFWVVGDKSEYLKQYLVKTSPEGYQYNDCDEMNAADHAK